MLVSPGPLGSDTQQGRVGASSIYGARQTLRGRGRRDLAVRAHLPRGIIIGMDGVDPRVSGT
jgi:hypothetical protein